MEFECPVCGYAHLRRPAADFLICPSCGTEFGYHDAAPDRSEAMMHDELREQWIAQGMPWRGPLAVRRVGWDPYVQLLQAGKITRLADLSAMTMNAGTPDIWVPRINIARYNKLELV